MHSQEDGRITAGPRTRVDPAKAYIEKRAGVVRITTLAFAVVKGSLSYSENCNIFSFLVWRALLACYKASLTVWFFPVAAKILPSWRKSRP